MLYNIRTSFFDRTEVSRSGSLLNTDKELTISLAVELMIPARSWSVGENSTWLPSKTTFTRNSGLGELLPSPFMARDSSCKDHFVFSLNASSTIRSILSVKRIQLFCTCNERQLTDCEIYYHILLGLIKMLTTEWKRIHEGLLLLLQTSNTNSGKIWKPLYLMF